MGPLGELQEQLGKSLNTITQSMNQKMGEMSPEDYAKVSEHHVDFNKAMRAAKNGDISGLTELHSKYAGINRK